MKPLIDFQILRSDDPNVIMIADASMWEHIENKPAVIEITTPGASSADVIKYFEKNQITIFNSVNMNMSCNSGDCEDFCPLPDGVYTIVLKGSPDSFFKQKKYLHTANTRLKLDELYVKSFSICEDANKGTIKLLDEIDFLITAAEANVRMDNINDAQYLFYKSQELIENLDVCK